MDMVFISIGVFLAVFAMDFAMFERTRWSISGMGRKASKIGYWDLLLLGPIKSVIVSSALVFMLFVEKDVRIYIVIPIILIVVSVEIFRSVYLIRKSAKIE